MEKNKKVTKKVTKKTKPVEDKLTMEMLELKGFDDINWIKYEKDVIEMKDYITDIYGKGYYKRIMKKITPKKQSWLKRLFSEED